MKSDHGRWPFCMVQLPWFNFLIPVYKAFGSLTRCNFVNWMWTKRNDHAPKVSVLIFLIYIQKWQLWIKFKSDHSFVFFCLHFLFPPPILIFSFINKVLWQYFYTMGPCLFKPKHLFCLSHRNTHWIMSVDNVGLQLCLLGTSNSMVTLTFSHDVKRNGYRTSSTTNHKFNKALGQLHGPWCEQPLSVEVGYCHVDLGLLTILC
jgi:hypothetical protein